MKLQLARLRPVARAILGARAMGLSLTVRNRKGEDSTMKR